MIIIIYMNKKYKNEPWQIQGENAEKMFETTCKKNGWKTKKTLYKNDFFNHFDFYIEGYNQKYKVEVKAKKKISRKDESYQDKWIWLELKGKNFSPGWIYGSKADFIAFEMEDSFILCKLSDLKKIIEKKIDIYNKVNSPKYAKYKVYSRFGCGDLLSLIHSDDVIEIMSLQFLK